VLLWRHTSTLYQFTRLQYWVATRMTLITIGHNPFPKPRFQKEGRHSKLQFTGSVQRTRFSVPIQATWMNDVTSEPSIGPEPDCQTQEADGIAYGHDTIRDFSLAGNTLPGSR